MTRDVTKAAILAAAAEIFARQGYDGASIAEITTEAKLSSGPVYGQFGSKAELFAATLEAHSDR
ncbi:MAG: helix-turn-helix transcriptional regulator, partial [Frankiales bacterium]|nr:helix-turn-helix transcriptional regulator [Frankiales bacterium]